MLVHYGLNFDNTNQSEPCEALNMSIVKTGHVRSTWFRHGTLEKKMFILIIVACIFVYIYYTLVTEDSVDEEQKDLAEVTASLTDNQRYLINTSTCRIPDIDPYNGEVDKYVHKEPYTNCTNLGLLTYIDKSSGSAILKVNSSLLKKFSYFNVKCCYSNIYRINFLNKSDNDISYSPCTEFRKEAVLSHPFIRVECSNVYRKVYSNTHATIIPRKKHKLAKETKGNRFSVLLVGIDSISKLNLIRTMPRTYSHLEQYFHSLKGYNKIGDNTFPNLMAILTGQNNSELRKTCNSKVKLNDCNIIWSTFRKLGYVTAYAEDECNIATFHYDRPGFRESPTNYYYRPYFIASERLGKKLRYGMTYCAGPETSGERMFNVVKDFSISFKDVPKFGLFWMNSFSHDEINLPSAMDQKVLDFLSDINFKVSLSNTFMVFFSDHGFRFGDIRYTHTGWLEERLPFIYIYIPDSFKKKFKDKYQNFVVNTERLTTPYDLYSTLQELLEIGNATYQARKGRGCPNCHSLFKKNSENRTCKAASIDQHWCTCTGHNYISPRNGSAIQVAQYVVEEINKFVKTFPEGKKCANYTLKKLVTAGMSEYYLNEKNQTVRYFLIIMETNPNAMFEATVEAHIMPERSSFKLLGDISRINRYKDNSNCVKSGALKKYCFCDGYFRYIKSFLCTIFSC